MTRFIAVAALLFAAAAVHAADKNVAMIKSYQGAVDITIGGKNVSAKKFLSLPASSKVTLGNGSTIELILFNGKKVTFVSGAKFEVTPLGVKALDADTEVFLVKNMPSDVYSKTDLMGSRGAIIVPDGVKKQIAEIDASGADDALKALLRGAVYKENGLKNLAMKEFKKYEDLTSGQTNR